MSPDPAAADDAAPRRTGTRGMPRPERERRILAQAGPVFGARGYHDASMDEIAALAGISKPMLYAYFGSKQGLYLAYLERTGRELVERLLGAALPGGEDGARARIEAPVSEFLAFVEEYSDGWRVLFRELAASTEVAREVASLREQIAGAVRAMLDEGGAGGPPPAADAIAHAIVGAGESIANWWLAHPEVTRAQVTGWYVGLVEAAIAPRA